MKKNIFIVVLLVLLALCVVSNIRHGNFLEWLGYNNHSVNDINNEESGTLSLPKEFPNSRQTPIFAYMNPTIKRYYDSCEDVPDSTVFPSRIAFPRNEYTEGYYTGWQLALAKELGKITIPDESPAGIIIDQSISFNSGTIGVHDGYHDCIKKIDYIKATKDNDFLQKELKKNFFEKELQQLIEYCTPFSEPDK